MITGNEPAMPIKGADERFFNCDNKADYLSWIEQCNPSIGLTIRQYFAAMAMQGLCASESEASWHPEDCAKASVQYADALINELNKERS